MSRVAGFATMLAAIGLALIIWPFDKVAKSRTSEFDNVGTGYDY